MRDILQELNEAQRAAVVHTDGPVMVIAGAGSGKTRVLTYRVAHLLYQGVDPFHILALTFTNKAAREMKERIIHLVGSADAKNVWMGTFHSIFARILRSEAHRLGYPSNYTIYDTDDSKSVLRSVVKDQNLDVKVYAPNYLLHRISTSKASLISARDYNENFEIQTQDKMAGKPLIGQLYTLYQKRCYLSSAMDFDDLLFNTYILFRDYPEILYKYQQKFRYILVDEYQDTNYAQYIIVKSLAANDENICVVGDDAQSIYAFRGASIQNILNFRHDYPDQVTFKLEQNYRSTKSIVSAANSVIVNNKNQISKQIWTHNEEGQRIQLIKATSDNEEGNLVAQSIFETKMNNQLQNDAFAILYRTNAQSRAMEEALRKLNIPYRIYGSLSFYQRKEIKDLLAYFRLVINNKDEEALLRIINYPARGIGKTSIEKVIVKAGELDKSIWEILENIASYRLGINSGTISRINDFVGMIKSFSVQMKKKNAYELGKLIASSSGIMKELYEDKTPEGFSRFENIDELLNAMKEFSEKEREGYELEGVADRGNAVRTLDEFLQEIALLTDADIPDKDDKNTISLMTVHAAKGLEFPFVYIVGMEENLFPSIQSINSRADLEEERRLFYVALTRAKQRVTISYADSRYRWGNLMLCEPSRFVDEIDPRYIDIPQKSRVQFDHFNLDEDNKPNVSQASFGNLRNRKLKKLNEYTFPGQMAQNGNNPIDPGLFQTGMEVEHERFGKGKIISIENAGANRKATVFFQSVGQKQLLLKFARLRIVK